MWSEWILLQLYYIVMYDKYDFNLAIFYYIYKNYSLKLIKN